MPLDGLDMSASRCGRFRLSQCFLVFLLSVSLIYSTANLFRAESIAKEAIREENRSFSTSFGQEVAKKSRIRELMSKLLTDCIVVFILAFLLLVAVLAECFRVCLVYVLVVCLASIYRIYEIYRILRKPGNGGVTARQVFDLISTLLASVIIVWFVVELRKKRAAEPTATAENSYTLSVFVSDEKREEKRESKRSGQESLEMDTLKPN